MPDLAPLPDELRLSDPLPRLPLTPTPSQMARSAEGNSSGTSAGEGTNSSIPLLQRQDSWGGVSRPTAGGPPSSSDKASPYIMLLLEPVFLSEGPVAIGNLAMRVSSDITLSELLPSILSRISEHSQCPILPEKRIRFEYYMDALEQFATLDSVALGMLQRSGSGRIRVMPADLRSSASLAQAQQSPPSSPKPKRQKAQEEPSSPQPLGTAAIHSSNALKGDHPDRRQSGRRLTLLPGGLPELKHLRLKPPRPASTLKQRVGRSSFSNAPTLGGRPLDDEHEAHPDVPTTVDWCHQFAYNLFKSVFILKITLFSVSLFDIILIAFVVFSTHCLMDWNLVADFNPSLFIGVLVFPLSFSVQSAYQRREKALADLATLKGATLNLFILYKDWAIACPAAGIGFLEDAEKSIRQMYHFIRLYLTCKYEPYKEYYLHGTYAKISDISSQTEELRILSGVPAPLFTRPIHDIQTIIASFEKLRVVTDYRTPSSIRSFTRIFLVLVCLMLTPHFAYLGLQFGRWSGLIISTVVPTMFVSLQNVQQQLENPFGTDHDDINLEHLRCVEELKNIVEKAKYVLEVNIEHDLRDESEPATAPQRARRRASRSLSPVHGTPIDDYPAAIDPSRTPYAKYLDTDLKFEGRCEEGTSIPGSMLP